MLNAITKRICASIPGTALNIAQQKREYEKKLRKEGYSRKEAMTMTMKHFSGK